jgi:hypothetical protein
MSESKEGGKNWQILHFEKIDHYCNEELGSEFRKTGKTWSASQLETVDLHCIEELRSELKNGDKSRPNLELKKWA